MTGYLRVKVGGAAYGLQVDQIVEVLDQFELFDAPGMHPAVSSVTSVRSRMVAVVKLGVLIGLGEPAGGAGGTLVLARCKGAVVAFEVDEAEELVLDEPLPVPDVWQLPWASGVARHQGVMIPVIDLETLTERLVSEETVPGGADGR